MSLEFWHEKFYPERKIVQDDRVIRVQLTPQQMTKVYNLEVL